MVPAQTADDDELPDMALLEYLAELVEVDGELVGPMDMADDKNIQTDANEQTKESNKQPTENSQEGDEHD